MATSERSAPGHDEIIVTNESTPGIEEIITEDGILSTIVSFLPLAEAVRTSVLSSRWKNIWVGRTRYVFTAISVLKVPNLIGNKLSGEDAYKRTRGHTWKFVQSVNSVVQQLQRARTNVDEFTVGFCLHEIQKYFNHFDAWVCFAMASKVKFLRLEFFKPHSNFLIQRYDFPCQLLRSSEFIERFSLFCSSLKLPSKFDGLSHVRDLSLGNVDITEEDFNRILSNCSSSLTRLSVFDAQEWKSLCFSHHLSQLKYLKVIQCLDLNKIEIKAVNLISLIYVGDPLDFKFRESSKLTHASICFEIDEISVQNLDFYLAKLSNNLPHLRSLSFKITGVSKVVDLPKHSSSFIHLTHLALNWNVGVKMSLLHLATLLETAPLLETLELCLQLSTQVEDKPPNNPEMLWEMLPAEPHPYIKKIEVSGFFFNTWQIRIAVYLLKNATELESMTIKKGPSQPSWHVSKKRHRTAMKIFKRNPGRAKLVFL